MRIVEFVKQCIANFDYIGLFNNDAVADKDWLKNLTQVLDENSDTGIVTCKLVDANNQHLDSTGDIYTVWGLPFPRGRGEPVSTKYDDKTDIFAASGGASLYRTKMLEEIGLFDEDFFAYYEDVDLSFRAQLAGWKVKYAPTSNCLIIKLAQPVAKSKALRPIKQLKTSHGCL